MSKSENDMEDIDRPGTVTPPSSTGQGEAASELAFSVPWQYDPDTASYEDPDGFPLTIGSRDKSDPQRTREALQELCWEKAQRNPQIATAVKGMVGRLTGFGFQTTSDIPEIQDAIDEIELDRRNRLYNYWPKFVGRSIIEGELFLCLTCHDSGFIEVDFIDPAAIKDGQVESGIIYHPSKTGMPLIYCINQEEDNGVKIDEHIPSIYLAIYPELLEVASKQPGFDSVKLNNSTKNGKFTNIGGFFRFVINFDKTYITKRNIGHVRTVLRWMTMYEDLKKYEMDHKKSAGSYLWAVTINDVKTWIKWLQLSDEDRRKTGIGAKKTPGGTMVLGPNMEIKAINPTLPNISDSDTDILHMVTAGLNEPEDVATGNTRGSTFASVKASRGPMSDRVSDEIAYFDRFLKHDFWGNIFFLKSKISSFPSTFKVKEVVDFTKDKKPITRFVNKRPEQLIEICFPMSEINDAEARARAYFGVKHGSLYDTAGIPAAEIARKMGFGNYRKLRLMHATEQMKYPELIPTVDQEGYQEKREAEPGKKKTDTKGESE
jgi:hypothetical protein